MRGRSVLTSSLVAANALVEKQRVQLIEAHKEGCPWKTRQCDGASVAAPRATRSDNVSIDSIYHVPLQAPLATIRDIKSRAVILDTVMSGVEIKHPLVSSLTLMVDANVLMYNSVDHCSDSFDSEHCLIGFSTLLWSAG